MEKKKILIISNFFYPEITPRAFRTTELVKEFVRQGFHVTLILPNKFCYSKNPTVMDGLTVVLNGKRKQSLSANQAEKVEISEI